MPAEEAVGLERRTLHELLAEGIDRAPPAAVPTAPAHTQPQPHVDTSHATADVAAALAASATSGPADRGPPLFGDPEVSAGGELGRLTSYRDSRFTTFSQARRMACVPCVPYMPYLRGQPLHDVQPGLECPVKPI